MNGNLHNIYHEQDKREAKDNDSNFSADSFKRKRRKSTKVRKPSGIDLKMTSMASDDEDMTDLMIDDSSMMGGDLSKVPSNRRLDDMKSLTMNPSKKSLGSGSVAQPGLTPMPSQISFTKSVGDKIMNNPMLSIRLSEGILIRGEQGEPMREAPPIKDLGRNFSIAEYKQI